MQKLRFSSHDTKSYAEDFMGISRSTRLDKPSKTYEVVITGNQNDSLTAIAM